MPTLVTSVNGSPLMSDVTVPDNLKVPSGQGTGAAENAGAASPRVTIISVAMRIHRREPALHS